METFRVRRAQEAEIPAVLELWKELMDFHAARDAHFTRAQDGHRSFGDYLRQHLAAGAFLTLAEGEGKPIGYCLAMKAKYPPVFRDVDYGFITYLLVTEAWRRRGVGQALLREALDWLAGQGLRRIEVRVAVSNEAGERFWRREGFRPYMEVYCLEIPEPDRGGPPSLSPPWQGGGPRREP
jgi:GNAT superfamily N-acetyltransferase